MTKLTHTFAAFGRTFVDETAPSYQLSQAIGAALARRGYGVMTGGYAGGLMEAVSKGAVSKGEDPRFARGVPIAAFDRDHEHIACGITERSEEDTIGRLQQFSRHCSAFVALPEGGFGTFDEIIHVIRENVTHEATPKPVILVGSHWLEALQFVFRTINSRKDPMQFPWLHVVNTLEEFEAVVDGLPL